MVLPNVCVLWLPVVLSAIITIILFILYVVSYVKAKRNPDVTGDDNKKMMGDPVPLIISGMLLVITIGLAVHTFTRI